MIRRLKMNCSRNCLIGQMILNMHKKIILKLLLGINLLKLKVRSKLKNKLIFKDNLNRNFLFKILINLKNFSLKIIKSIKRISLILSKNLKISKKSIFVKNTFNEIFMNLIKMMMKLMKF